MFRATTELLTQYQSLLGWKEHYDTGEVDIDNALTVSQSGEYYQDFHSALRLDIIKALIPDNYPIDTYLADKISSATTQMLNDLWQYRNLNNYGKTLLKSTQLFNKYGWLNDKIVNEGRFVGIQIRLKSGTGIQAVIEEIGLQFEGSESFNLYLFHSSKTLPLATIPVTTSGAAQWDWTSVEHVLDAHKLENYNEGVYIVGYYQDDLTLSAINNTNFNFDKGVCGSCNKPNFIAWRDITEYFTLSSIYVPSGSYTVGEMFDLNDAFSDNSKTYGLNFRLTTKCDLTDFFIQNKFSFKNLLGLKVTSMLLNDMKHSQQINYIEENIKMMIIRDLEGDRDTRLKNIPEQYRNELEAVAFNTGGINEKCLACKDSAIAPMYSVI
jgi:hypothetical protein